MSKARHGYRIGPYVWIPEKLLKRPWSWPGVLGHPGPPQSRQKPLVPGSITLPVGRGDASPATRVPSGSTVSTTFALGVT